MTVTLNFPPSAQAISLVWINPTDDPMPRFDVFVPGATANDVVTVQIDDNTDFSSPTNYIRTITAARYAAHEATGVLFVPLANGTWHARARYSRASGTSDWSATATTTINADQIAPVLSAPVGIGLTYSTATIGATTDEDNGTLYYVVTTSPTQPTVAQIVAGQTHTGTAALISGSQVVSTTGAQVINLTGVSNPGGTIYAHHVQKDMAGNPSNRVTSAGFTIPLPSGVSFNPTAPVGSFTLSNANRTVLITGNPTAARSLVPYSGKRLVAFTYEVNNVVGGTPAGSILPILNATGVGNAFGWNDPVPYSSVSWGYNGWIASGGVQLLTGPTFNVGDTLGVATDDTALVFWVTKDGINFYGASSVVYTRGQLETGAAVGTGYTNTDALGPVYAGVAGGGVPGTQFTMLTAWPWAAVATYTYLE